MVEMAYKSTSKSKIANHTEGAILSQLIMQYFEGTQALHSGVFERLLNSTIECTSSVPQAPQGSANQLKKHLLGVFLSASLYSAEATFTFLTQKNTFVPILTEITKSMSQFKHDYERHLYIMGLSSLIKVGAAWSPESLLASVQCILKQL